MPATKHTRNYQRNLNGRLFFDHSQHGLYTVKFPDEPTFISPAGKPSTLDFFLSNFELSKPMAINVTPAQSLRKDYHHVNWVQFGHVVDRNSNENPPFDNVEDIDRALEGIHQAISVDDETCVRQVPVRGKFVAIGSHTQLLIRLRNVRRRQFQRTGDLLKNVQ